MNAKGFFFLSLLANAVNSGHDRGEEIPSSPNSDKAALLILLCSGEHSPPSAVSALSQSEIANQSDCLNHQEYSVCIC